MTIAELIEKLSKFDQTKTVKFQPPASPDTYAEYASVWHYAEDDEPPIPPENDFVVICLDW